MLRFQRSDYLIDFNVAVLLARALEQVGRVPLRLSPMHVATILLKADPAILILTLTASHVVAALILVARHEALGAEFSIHTSLPLKEFFIMLPTLASRVVQLAALETDNGAALTRGFLCKHAFLLDVSVAV